MAGGSLNKATIIGRLGNDPEIRYATSGAAIANVSIATNERWKDKSSGEMQERTEWHRVIFFGKLAEIVEQYLAKGSQIYVEGRLQTRKWSDKEGQDRYTTEIVANEMQMLGGRDGDSSTSNFPPKQQTARDKPPAASTQDTNDGFDDDIPF